MPLATITKTTIAANFTQAQLNTALVNALNNCGFSSGTPTSTGTVSGEIRTMYTHQFNASSKGTAYCEFSISSSLALIFKVSDNYNTSTYTAAGQGFNTSIGISNTAAHDIFAVNHPEIKGVGFLQQGSTSHSFLGFLRPANLPSWWNQNSFLYCAAFGTMVSSSQTYNLPFPNPYSSSSTINVGLLAWMGASSPPPLGGFNGDNTSDLLLSPLLYANARGYFGQTSSDIALGRINNTSGQALAPGDKYIVTAGSQEYTIIFVNSGFGVALRTA